MIGRENRGELFLPATVSTDGGPVEAASFVSAAVAELARLARRHRLDMLAHVLEMAQLEADDFVRQQERG